MPVRKSAKKTSALKQSPIRSLYGPAIRDAIKQGDATEMKALAVKARKHIREVTSALAALEKKIAR